MTSYRRRRRPGGTYFFTVHLAAGEPPLLVDHVDLLRWAWARTCAERPFRCDAAVVLPDHLHAVWQLPQGDADFSTRWGAIKSRFTRALKGRMGFNPILRSPSKALKGDAGLWQRRFWEHCIRDRADHLAHLAYCWNDPVEHGLVAHPEDWPFSSIHRDVRAGLVDDRGLMAIGTAQVGWVSNPSGCLPTARTS